MANTKKITGNLTVTGETKIQNYFEPSMGINFNGLDVGLNFPSGCLYEASGNICVIDFPFKVDSTLSVTSDFLTEGNVEAVNGTFGGTLEVDGSSEFKGEVLCDEMIKTKNISSDFGNAGA